MGHYGLGEALDCSETLWAQTSVQEQPGPLNPEVVEPEKELILHMLQLLIHSMQQASLVKQVLLLKEA